MTRCIDNKNEFQMKFDWLIRTINHVPLCSKWQVRLRGILSWRTPTGRSCVNGMATTSTAAWILLLLQYLLCLPVVVAGQGKSTITSLAVWFGVVLVHSASHVTHRYVPWELRENFVVDFWTDLTNYGKVWTYWFVYYLWWISLELRQWVAYFQKIALTRNPRVKAICSPDFDAHDPCCWAAVLGILIELRYFSYSTKMRGILKWIDVVAADN